MRARGHYALSRRYFGALLASGALLALSGVTWLVGHFALARADEFGQGRHPLEGWALAVHGAAAMAFLVVLGALLPVHARRAWHAGLNHASGLTVLGLAGFLVATGYGLYYSGSESLRPWLSTGHWLVGLAGVAVVWLHALLGRRAAAALRARLIERRGLHPADGHRRRRGRHA